MGATGGACVCPESIDLNRLRDLVADKLVGPMKPKSWETMEKLPFLKWVSCLVGK